MGKRKKSLPKETVTVIIESLNHEGRGVAHIQGKAIFINGALPQETVQFRYTKMHRQWDEGEVVAVLIPHPDRISPPCQHFSQCGGCSLQHLNSDHQLAHKEKVLLELLQHQVHLVLPSLLPALKAEDFGYRRKARLGVKYVEKKGKVLVGFREKNGRYLADLEKCLVLHPAVGKKLTLLSELIYHCKIRDEIPQIEIAVAENTTVLIVRHLVSMPASDQERWKIFAQEHHFSIFLQPYGIDSIHPLWPENEVSLTYSLPRYTLTFTFKPTQFTQINFDINQKMIDRAIDLLELHPEDSVLDLFCGIGNFSLPLSLFCKSIVGIEGDLGTVEQAKKNALLNHRNNTSFYPANLFESVKEFSWAKQHFDKILLDPPRTGAKEIIEFFPLWNPSRIVYISCNPATFARDAKRLNELGYHLEKAGVMDMFPHTKHIEVIGLFVKK